MTFRVGPLPTANWHWDGQLFETDTRTLKATKEAVERMKTEPKLSPEEWAYNLAKDLSEFTD